MSNVSGVIQFYDERTEAWDTIELFTDQKLEEVTNRAVDKLAKAPKHYTKYNILTIVQEGNRKEREMTVGELEEQLKNVKDKSKRVVIYGLTNIDAIHCGRFYGRFYGHLLSSAHCDSVGGVVEFNDVVGISRLI